MAMGNVPVPFGVVLGLAVFFVASGMPRRWSVPAAAVTAAGLGAALLYAALAVPHASPASEIVEGFVPLVAPWFVITISQPLGVSYRLYYYYVMTQREKRSVSLPPDLARAVDQAAEAQGTTFSGWLAETAARRLKLEAGRQAIAEWERENGPLTEAERADGLARARASLGRAPAPAPAPATERKSA